ncbi:ABC transporter permease [Vibrio bivalvicida]|uniref:ABC transporter permease n=1 Tax=Vibrio bivalvicida TaxID=1276888 RepID=A0A177Y2T1_9VIBR|nr:ABC transporter permease [Vibrio bivalvicida]OAJ95140.1 ABC transporter permease [Vibrio bivalvicida]
MGKLIPQSLRIAYLNLQRNKRRSVLSLLIIAIAIFALTSAGGFGLYTYDSLQESTARDTGHLTISQPGFFEKDEEMPLANGLADGTQLTQRILANNKVRGVQPRIEFTGLVSNGSKSTIFVGTGVNEREFDMKGPFLDVRQGKTLSSIQSSRYDPSEPEVMLGVDLARNLSVEPGDWVTLLATTSDGALNAYDYKVRGIYSTGVPELDKRQLYIHIKSAQELLSSDRVSTLSVFLFDTEQTLPMKQWVEAQLAAMDLKQPVEITPWQDRAFFYTKVKDLYDRIFGIMGAVMALVVFVALFNTMTMSVTERTREIGTLSALGTYPGEIVSGFVRESALLAMIGASIGGVLSFVVSLLLMVVDVQMPPPPGRSEGYPLNIYFSPELLITTAIGVLIICVVAAWLSASKGVKKPITEALIYV